VARIVIADDSPTLRRIVTSVLTKEGHEVIAAQDGIEAVQAAFQHQPDAIVLDVQMPRVSGFIAARLLKDDWQTADIPVVMLTSLDAASDRYWAGQAGVDRYLTKDFEAPELAGAIDEVLLAAQASRGGRARLTPDVVELAEEDVLARICDLLDRKLFESSVAQSVMAIGATANGLEASVAALLGVFQRFVGYDLAAVMLGGERRAYVAVGAPTARAHYVDDPDELANGADMSTFLSMPLRGHGGSVVGVLALSSAVKQAFGETALSTLKLIEGPAAIVIDNARLAGVG
jgi:twitching motility two-component system response regulator PilH